jgi:glyoxylase-like metal-dependent hydrolase (beta-lactamase superfamily II)
MKQISKHLYQIPLGSVNTFLIEDNGLTLIDTGFKNNRDKIFQAIRNGGKNPDDIKQIILTHSHQDHSGSVADIKATLDVPVYAHPEDAILVEAGIGGRLPHQPSPGMINWLLFHLFINNSPNETETCRIDERIQDGDTLPIAGGIQVIHTPGHSKGHISLLLKNDRVLISGDICANMFGLDFSVVYEDRHLGVQSILKVAAYDFDKAVFGHGNPLVGSANAKLNHKFSPLVNT